MTVLSLPLAILRGLFFCVMALLLGIFQDMRLIRTPWPHLGLMVMTGTGLAIGIVAFYHAWNWAGIIGPAHLLTARACGVALGTLVPALIACHALYFHWVNLVESACIRGLVRLLDLAIRRQWLG